MSIEEPQAAGYRAVSRGPGGPKRRDDAALLAACRRGEGSAWDELIRRYRRLIYSIPFAYKLGADAADEIFQRVAVALVENVATIREPERLAAWIAVTTRRACWAWSREGSRTTGFEEGQEEALVDEEPEDVADSLARLECEHVLRVALERLDEPCRELLTALYVEHPTPSYSALAERLGRPIGSLGPTRARCLQKLKRLYRQEGGGDLPA